MNTSTIATLLFRYTLIALCILISTRLCVGAEMIAVTELMRDPAGTETSVPGGASHEFIEFTNLGSTDFSLDSLILTDGQDRDSVVAWTTPLIEYPACIYGATVLKPGQTAIILDPDYDSAITAAPLSRYTIADSTVILTIKDNDLGSTLAAAEGVLLYKGSTAVLIRAVAAVIDSGIVPDIASGGLSLVHPANTPEGVSVIAQSVLFSQWSSYAPCPTQTSLGRYEFLDHGWLSEYRFGLASAGTVSCTAAVKKTGSASVTGARFFIARGHRNADTLAATAVIDPITNTIRLTMRVPLDTIASTITIIDGAQTITRQIDLSPVWTPATAIRINEVFPRATATIPEWFELYNTSTMPVDLRNWRFGNGESVDTLSTASVVIQPGAYMVFTSDPVLFRNAYPATRQIIVPVHWHTLGNYQDSLLLWNASQVLMETAVWDYHWFSSWENQSLERILPSADGRSAQSWVVADPSSPGLPNGSTAWRVASEPSLTIGPTPFTPNNDGRDDRLAIAMVLPAGMQAQVKIYGIDGTVYRSFGQQTVPKMLWDGKRDNGTVAPVGPFFVVAELSGGSRKMIRMKGVLWR